jgi:phosphoribosylformimino-5-aminoimidazole carboxamide ribotide isomerase
MGDSFPGRLRSFREFAIINAWKISKAAIGEKAMKFRPCIDIHNGKVKQIVGGSLRDVQDEARENFVSEQDASFYADLYKKAGLTGGHVILLNSADSPYYEATRQQALLALGTYPGGLQLGGGVNPTNAKAYLEAGASHVIVTSYVFKDGQISWERIREMERCVGRKHLVLDLSCRRRNAEDPRYYIVTDRWQNFTDVPVTLETMERLGEYCDEFLVHAVDVEGKARGIEEELARLLGNFAGCPVTYAGGVGSMEDIQTLGRCSGNRLDVTVGSALDLFGGSIPFEKLKNLDETKMYENSPE